MNRKLSFKHILYSIMIVAAAGCGKEKEVPTVEVLTKDFMVPSAGEVIKVEISTNTGYTIEIPSAAASWISSHKTRAMSEFSHYFKIEQNETYDLRTAQINFVNSETGEHSSATVTQMQKDAIIIAAEQYNFDFRARNLEFEVSANVDYDISISEKWIREGGTKAMETDKRAFRIEENQGEEPREGKITFSNGEVSQTVTITQLGKSDMINLSVEHSESTFHAPVWTGEYTSGLVIWGDGKEEEYHSGMYHYFQESSLPATTIFDMYGVSDFEIQTIGTISTITINYD